MGRWSFFLGMVVVLAALAGMYVAYSQESQVNKQDDVLSEPLDDLIEVEVSMGFFPSVQFAPFYVAQSQGLFRENGLEVVVDHSLVDDIIRQVASGDKHFAISDGDAVLIAQGQDINVRSVMMYYPKTPAALVSLASSSVQGKDSLRGATIGLPGLYGSSYLATLAYLDYLGINSFDVSLEPIGYNQLESLQARQVDGVVVFSNNELEILKFDQVEVVVQNYAQEIDYVGNVILTSEMMIETQPEVTRAFVKSLQEAMVFVVEDPEAAWEITARVIDFHNEEDIRKQRAIFEATLELWQEVVDFPQVVGGHDEQVWQSTYDFLKNRNFLIRDFSSQEAYSNEFLY